MDIAAATNSDRQGCINEELTEWLCMIGSIRIRCPQTQASSMILVVDMFTYMFMLMCQFEQGHGANPIMRL